MLYNKVGRRTLGMETFRRYLFCKGTKKSWIFGMIRGILWFFENWEGGGRKQRCPTGSGRPLRDSGSGGGRLAEKRGCIQDWLFSFCKIRIVNSYLILFFIEFFFHFICLFQKSIYLCMCNKQREHMNQFIHIINLAVLHIIIRVVVLKPMRWAGVHIWMSEIR